MRMLGYCADCHRIRQVRVDMRRWTGSIPTGICTECEQAQETRRGERRELR